MDAAKFSSSRNPAEVPEQQSEQLSCQDDIWIVFETKARPEGRSLKDGESVPQVISTNGGDETRPYKAAGHGHPSLVSSRSSKFRATVTGGRGHGRTDDNGSVPAYLALSHEASAKLETEILWHKTLDVLNEMYVSGDLHPSWVPTLQKCYQEKWQTHRRQ